MDSAPTVETTNPKKKRPDHRPARFTERLGVFGWQTLDPVLLGALAAESPVLLVGPHGTAKTMLVERLAVALDLELRHYNASLVNYDDLVGIPMPDESGETLRFVSSPAAVWDAEFVFLDEISRCRPDVQNKLFSLIHERKVAGVPIAKLRHRWAAMNPPAADDPADSGDAGAAYLGAEPLDPALADRFPFVVRVPGWGELRREQRLSLLREHDSAPRCTAARDGDGGETFLAELVARTAATLDRLETALRDRLAEYVVLFIEQLQKAALPQSPRRARMLVLSILAVHAARVVLGLAGDDVEPSVEMAVRHGLPQSASETPPSVASLMAAHKEAWAVSGLKADSAWRQVLEEPDPVKRVVLGDRLSLCDGDFSRLVTQALAAVDSDARRVSLATAMFLSFKSRRRLDPAAWEPLAQLARRVLEPRAVGASLAPGKDLDLWREINSFLVAGDAECKPTPLERNYLLGGFPDLWQQCGWKHALEQFRRDLRLFADPEPREASHG